MVYIVVVAFMAKAASIDLSVDMLTVLSFVGTAVHVIAVIAHAFRIVFPLRMGTVGVALDFLFSRDASVHSLTFHKLQKMIKFVVFHRNCSVMCGMGLRMSWETYPFS